MIPKPGDLLWQRCLPGGICLFIRNIGHDVHWLEGDWDGTPEPETYEVLHPTLGCIEEPEYYFETLDTAIEDSYRKSI
jgi:hypothetical protein